MIGSVPVVARSCPPTVKSPVDFRTVGPGYVPPRSFDAAPDGGPPSDVPHTTSVPFDCKTYDALPSGKRTRAGVALPTRRSPRASGVVTPSAAPFSFATVGAG